MYRKIKNTLGVSLIIMSVVIGQIPMPETQAEVSGKKTTHTVSFSMNGGSFKGTYNDYSFINQMPVLVLDNGEAVESFPQDKYATYEGYRTEKDVWYTDKECLVEFKKDSKITESITLYKKWYNITSDGNKTAKHGFYLNPEQTVLYKYDGNEKLVSIPDTVEVIANDAFTNIGSEVRGISLPDKIQEIEENAFSGVDKCENIIYIYDADTKESEDFGKMLDDKYEQLVHSVYLDVDAVGDITGIDYGVNVQQPDDSSKQKSVNVAVVEKEKNFDESENEKEEPSSVEESNKEETSEAKESASETIVIEPDEEYMVTFVTGIDGVSGEKRTVLEGRTVSEMVKIDDNQPLKLKPGEYNLKKDDGKQEIEYLFQGWYKDSQYKNKWNFASDVIEGDTLIYAKWDINYNPYYYVRFVAEGAENVPDTVKLYKEDKLVKPKKNPEIKDKEFKGWFTDSQDMSSKFTAWNAPVSEDLTLYAQWESKGYVVTFDMNGGSFTGNYDGTPYNDAAKVENKIVIGKGIENAEYPKSDNSSTIKYGDYSTDDNWYTDKQCLNVYSQKDSSGNAMILSKDITLYKKWYYTTNGFTLNPEGTVLYKYSGNDKAVVIPDTVNTIASNAFADMINIESITLNDKVTDIKENAFATVSGRQVTIITSGKADNVKQLADLLVKQYTNFVHKTKSTSDVTVTTGNKTESTSVSVVNSGDIKLGAVINMEPSVSTNSQTAQIVNMPAGNIITVDEGTTDNNKVTVVNKDPQTVTVTNDNTTVNNGNVVNTTTTTAQNIAAQNTVNSNSYISASTPRSNQHIKDYTPKTGGDVQYRTILVCALFSAGVLLLLVGNEKKGKPKKIMKIK